MDEGRGTAHRQYSQPLSTADERLRAVGKMWITPAANHPPTFPAGWHGFSFQAVATVGALLAKRNRQVYGGSPLRFASKAPTVYVGPGAGFGVLLRTKWRGFAKVPLAIMQ